MPPSRGGIYAVLANPLYVGRIPHRDTSYAGQHEAIIDRKTWDAVQAHLAAQAHRHATGAGSPSLLRKKIFDEAGVPLTPSHTVKAGRRYRYYVSREGAEPAGEKVEGGQSRGWRLSAREIERFVAGTVAQLFANPAELARLAREAKIAGAHLPSLLEQVRSWNGAPLDLVSRVDLSNEEIVVAIDFSRLLGMEGAVVRHEVPVRMRTPRSREAARPQSRATPREQRADRPGACEGNRPGAEVVRRSGP